MASLLQIGNHTYGMVNNGGRQVAGGLLAGVLGGPWAGCTNLVPNCSWGCRWVAGIRSQATIMGSLEVTSPMQGQGAGMLNQTHMPVPPGEHPFLGVQVHTLQAGIMAHGEVGGGRLLP